MRDATLYDRNDPHYIAHYPPSSPTLKAWEPELETAPSTRTQKPYCESSKQAGKARRRHRKDPGSVALFRHLAPNNPELARLDSDPESSSESEVDEDTEMTNSPASTEKPTVDGIDKAMDAVNVSPKSTVPETRDTAPDAYALKVQANAVLQCEAPVATSRIQEDDEPAPKPRVDSAHDKIEHFEKRSRSGRATPNLTVKTEPPISGKDDDTIAMSPTLRKYVIPVAENAPGTLPAMQCSPTKDGPATSPQNETLPPLHHVTSQMREPLNQLATAAVATQQAQMYTHYPGQPLTPGSAQSPIIPYHNCYGNATSPSGQHSLSATSPTSPNSEQYYGSPTQYRPTFLTGRRPSAGNERKPRFPPSLPSASSSGGSHSHTGSSTDGYSTSHTTPIDSTQTAQSTPGQMLPPSMPGFKCDYPGCTALPFHTQYLLSSHKNVHSLTRDHYCPVKDCPRGVGGKGFKRKNEMMRHGLVHSSPGYICPFCPEKEHRYPRPDNLQRHVRVHHVDKDRDDPQLREVLAQRTEGTGKTRRRRTNTNSSA